MSAKALRCVYPSAISPFTQQVEDQTRDWCLTYGLIAAGETEDRFMNWRMGHLAGRSYWYASRNGLLLNACWMAWYFIFDDQLDSPPYATDPARVAEICRRLRGISESERPGQSTTPAENALADLVGQSCSGMSPMWILRFRRHIGEYLLGNVREVQNRKDVQVPSLDRLWETRRASGAMEICIDMIEKTQHFEFSPSEWELSRLREARHLTSDIVHFTNDLYSLEREISRRDVNNLVLSISRERNCGIKESCRIAVIMVRDMIQRLQSCEVELMQSTHGEAARGRMERFFLGLNSWVRGNVDWAQETLRYDGEHQYISEDDPWGNRNNIVGPK
ncbi:terpene synthase family protein [Streptomyces sp. FIT100]|uniref:terpene synthase family protein n=1 Tax=Streptomyces sp. FIT100 TaxID=2837956 RepID=UPI0021C590BB|nr:hypothetical protein [Streptomyces sp. FIT100]UUN29792.1 hypothetical protein KK483_28000 [Streptomyces sp. FIT100]